MALKSNGKGEAVRGQLIHFKSTADSLIGRAETQTVLTFQVRPEKLSRLKHFCTKRALFKTGQRKDARQGTHSSRLDEKGKV